MSKKSDYPKVYKHPVTEQERTATNKAQEVHLQFDGYRVVEAEAAADESTSEGEKTDAEKTATPPAAPKTATPKPSAPKAQETK